MGANDGASGVGALLEIARLVNQQQPELGIDIILLDAEDYGAPQFYTGQHKEEFWCLDHSIGHAILMYRDIMHVLASCSIW